MRARYLAVVDGACQRYDLDGVELNWLRSPIRFLTEPGWLRYSVPATALNKGRNVLDAALQPATAADAAPIALDEVRLAIAYDREGS